MEKLFKRNSSYYYRSKIPKNLQIYFNQKQEYIISLKTNNKNDAKLIVRFLDTKLNYIKSSYMQLTTKQISQYITEFKAIHFDDILNRNSYLSIEQIDENIKALNCDIDVYDKIIENELYDLMQMLNTQYNIDQLFDLDTDDIDMFKKYCAWV